MPSSSFFEKLVSHTRRIGADDFARDFGGIDYDVMRMLTSDEVQSAVHTARERMESAGSVHGQPRLRALDFGKMSAAPELEGGAVAAIDGTFVLPLQRYSAGQVVAVGVGSMSYRRPLLDHINVWSSQAFMDEADDMVGRMKRQTEALFKLSTTAILRYHEVECALEVEEPYIFLDGTLVYEWLVGERVGVDLYARLLSRKSCIGVMKSLSDNVQFGYLGLALRRGEAYIYETLEDHLEGSGVTNKNHGESGTRYVLDEFRRDVAPHILRGIFKPSKKFFGFEVHEDHLEDMLRIMAADCQINNIGHEIPYLLNSVDIAVRKVLSSHPLRARISSVMARESEDIFFEQSDERDFR